MSDPWPPRAPETPAAETPAAETPADETPLPASPVTETAPPVAADPARPSPNRRALLFTIGVVAVMLVLAFVLATLAAGPVVAPGGPTFPPPGATAAPAGAAAAATRSSVVSALAAVGLQVEDVQSPYRPAEAARLAGAPRVVLRAVIPSDPDHGRVVIYEFLSTAEATAAAQEQAAYAGSGVGLVQFPLNTQFVIRVVGSTVVFHAWSAANSPDVTQAAAVATALGTLGFGVSIPN